ncbi:hypothetical protein CRE_05247 [Caenorhabditis remanei]|uniref:F-box domain-containing protein n=1 Tax=Caenorhabditis remanei TaxID=31234 RepID=E3NID2_CAERE|nr:hypothetical protein CRE_05247 [Caenorhabditis remanei]
MSDRHFEYFKKCIRKCPTDIFEYFGTCIQKMSDRHFRILQKIKCPIDIFEYFKKCIQKMSDRHFRVLQKMYSENVRPTFSNTSEHVFRKCPIDIFEYFKKCIQKMSDRHFRILRKMYSENVRQTFSSTSEHVFRKCPTDIFEYFKKCIQKMSDRHFRVLQKMYSENVRPTFSSTSKNVFRKCPIDIFEYFKKCIQKMSDRHFRVLQKIKCPTDIFEYFKKCIQKMSDRHFRVLQKMYSENVRPTFSSTSKNVFRKCPTDIFEYFKKCIQKMSDRHFRVLQKMYSENVRQTFSNTSKNVFRKCPIDIFEYFKKCIQKMSDRHFRVLQKMYSENVRQTFSSTSKNVFRKCPTDIFEYFKKCIQKMSDRHFRVLQKMYSENVRPTFSSTSKNVFRKCPIDIFEYFKKCIQKMSDRHFRVLQKMYSENVRPTFSSTSKNVFKNFDINFDSPFPLLRLPRLVQCEIFKSLNIEEKIMLSFCSKRISTQINNYRLYSQKVIVDLDCFKQVIDIQSENNQDIFQVGILPDSRISHSSTIQKLSIACCTVRAEYLQKGMKTFWNNCLEGFLSIIHHLLKIFQCKMSTSFNSYCSDLFQPIILKLFDLQLEFKRLSICLKRSMEENLLWNQISNNLGLVEYLSISSSLDPAFEQVFTSWPRKIRILDSDWFTLETLLSCTCSKIILEESLLENKDFDVVLRKWKTGGFPNLKLLWLASPKITDNGEQILGMNLNELDEKVIQTDDGSKKATIKLSFLWAIEIYVTPFE